MNTPVISVIVPVYNVEKYLRACLDSIVNQTMREIEIICVDDGATDSSGQILDEYAAQDSRIRVVHKTNGGQGTARNVGLDLAKGTYVLFLDSDDHLALDLCEKTFRKAEQTQADMTLFYYSEDAEGEIREVSFPDSQFLGTSRLGNMRAFFELGPMIWKLLWRRSFIESNSLRFPEDTQWEDTVFLTRASFLAEKTALLPESLYFYRVNPNSCMRKKDSPIFCRNNVRAYNLAWEQIRDLQPPREIQTFLLTQKLLFVYYGYTHSAPKFLREFRKNIREGILPHELEMVRKNEVEILPLIRYFFLSIYGSFPERTIAKFKLWKYHAVRWAERTFGISIYPKE